MHDRDLVRLARALADPTRLRILRAVAEGGAPCCGAITREVPVGPATVSHHLRILVDAGLVKTTRDGQFIHVRASRRRLNEFRAALAAVFSSAAGRGARRRTRTGHAA